jgi:hypothetical protein
MQQQKSYTMSLHQSNNRPDRKGNNDVYTSNAPTNTEWLHFALTLLGAACTLIFSFIGWLIRSAVKRAVAEYVKVTNELKQFSHESSDRYEEFKDFREWVRFIMAVAGIVHQDGTPTDKKYH